MSRSPWLLSDPDFNGNFIRKWCEPGWVLRWDLRESRDRPPDKRKRPGTAPTVHRPLSNNIINASSDCKRPDRAAQARRAAEALFSRRGVR
jgi:hypothetical protein